MKTVFKYELLNQINQIFVPKYSEILTAQYQESTKKVVLWALIDTTEELVERLFRIYMTGEQLDDTPQLYLTTIQKSNGLVGHVFEQFKIPVHEKRDELRKILWRNYGSPIDHIEDDLKFIETVDKLVFKENGEIK